MDSWIQVFITIFTSVLASSGLWSYLEHHRAKKDASGALLLGLAHDRIMFLGQSYIDRGWITRNEYEDFITYLWQPYEAAGGNGTGKKMMEEINKLPITKHDPQ